MKKNINVKNSDNVIEALRKSDFFICRELDNSLKVKYHGTAGAIAPPIIRLKRQSDTELEVTVLTNTFLLIVTLLITVFFWLIAFLAYLKDNQNTIGIIIALCAPCVMWVLDIFITNQMSKLIIDEIKNVENDNKMHPKS